MPKFKIGDRVVNARDGRWAYVKLVFASMFSPPGYLIEFVDGSRETVPEEELTNG